MITPVINLVSKTAFILFFFLNRRAYTIEYKDIWRTWKWNEKSVWREFFNGV